MNEVVDRRVVEEAIGFLVDAMRGSGRNPKPVVLHSIRVGLSLLESSSPTEVVVAAILHDVVEDSDVTLDQVRDRFGNDVVVLVEANTFDPSHDRAMRDRDTLERCVAAGREALLVKCADILENWEYFSTIGPAALDELFRAKAHAFLDRTRDVLAEEQVWQRLQGLYDGQSSGAERG